MDARAEPQSLMDTSTITEQTAQPQEPAGHGLLASVAAAAQALLTSANLDQSIRRALEAVGLALDVDRASIFETHLHPQTDETLISGKFEWLREVSSGASSAGLQNSSLPGTLPRWHAALSSGQIIRGLVRDMPPGERAFLEPLGVKSILIVPIVMQERGIGFVTFQDCRSERQWRAEETSILMTMAACLGGAISRLRSDEATRASMRKYRSLFETSRDGIVITTMDGRIEDANRAYLEMLGYSFEEVLKLPYQSLTPMQWSKLDSDIIRDKVLKRGYCDEYEKEYVRRDGSVHPVSVRVWLVRDEQGQPSRMWRIVRDISERKRMEESLRASERQLRIIVDKLPVGVWLTDAQGRIILCNPAGESIWGGRRLSGIEQYGQCAGWWHGTGRRIQPHEWAPLRALTRGEVYVNEIIDIETPEGVRKTISHSAIPVRDDAGGIVGIVVINEDISERQRAEQRLRDSEERHRRITQALSDYVYTVWVKDGRAVSTEHGAACEAVTGYTRDDFSSNPYLWLRMVLEEDRPAVIELGRRILAGEPTAPLDHRIIRKDGRIRWVRNTPVPHRDARGALLYYDGVIQDITERHEAQDRMRQSQEMLRLVLDNIPQRVFWKGRDFRYMGCNRAFLRDAGLRAFKDVVGKDDFELSWKETAPVYRADDKFVMEHDQPKVDYEEPQHKPDGGVMWLRSNKLPLHDKDGKVIAVLGTYEDITQRKQAEESLRFTQFAVDNCTIPAFWIDCEGRLTYVNDAACRSLGYSAQELLGLRAWEVGLGLEEKNWQGFWKDVCLRRSVVLEGCGRAKDGRVFPVEVAYSFLEHGGKQRCFAVVQDITERKRGEEAQGS